MTKESMSSDLFPTLANERVFSEMPHERLAELFRNATVFRVAHREQIVKAGDLATHFGLVLSGAFKLTRIGHRQEEVILHFLGPMDFFAAMIMATPDSKYPVSATAMGPSSYLSVPRENYVQEWVKYPNLVSAVQQSIVERMDSLQSHRMMQRAPITARVATVLMNLAASSLDGQELALPMPLTRRELAEAVGGTVETVIRVMSEWSKQGIVRTDEQRIVIVRPDLLLEYSRDQAIPGS